MNYDSFGQVLAVEGDRIKITNKVTGVTLEGVVRSDVIRAGRVHFQILLDGTNVGNAMRVDDWRIDVLFPEVEDGWYQSKWNKESVYRVAGETITFLNVTSTPSRSTMTRQDFAREVASGKLIPLKAVAS